MTNSFDDLETAGCIFVIGSNTTACHPLIATRIYRAKERGARVIVADPRRTQLGDLADLSVHHRLGSDVALLNGMMHWIIENGWHDQDYIAARTEGFEALAATVAGYSPQRVQAITGVPADDIKKMAELYATCGPAALLYAMGITQHTTGVDNVKSCCNIALLCGNVGVAGGGVNPLRGQNNV
ncbi:MAG: formate dehydrogenase H subunit alpha, selenocysteine-containing, partial [Deltaproteobacteria bacterium]